MLIWGFRAITDEEYQQRIRRFRPSDLLPQIAARAAAVWGMSAIETPFKEWALADMARVSLASGNEHRRSAIPTLTDLGRMHDAYMAFDDPFTKGEPLVSFLLRMGGEQLSWQTGDGQSQARSAAILTQTSIDRELEVLAPGSGWEEDLLGCSLVSYVATSHLLAVSAIVSGGRFDPAIIDTPDGAWITKTISRETVTSVIDQHFATNVNAFRAADRMVTAGAGRRRRFTSSPLRDKPALTGFGPGYLVPSPRLALAKATPKGLYYTGVARYGDAFARDLGHLFEAYVGRQLHLLGDADVHGEITYLVKKQELKSVDWIVVFNDVVLLVEVKSLMPRESARLGLPQAVGDIFGRIQKACKQIDRTAAHITSRHPDFAHIPADRPLLGLAITLEAFEFINASNLDRFLPTTVTPVCVASAAELEALVTITDTSMGTLLRDRAADPERSTWSVNGSFPGHTQGDNAVLDQAWNSYAWSPASLGATSI